jgi:hypothetical protein
MVNVEAPSGLVPSGMASSYSISNNPSTSTAASAGSDGTPIVVRA